MLTPVLDKWKPSEMGEVSLSKNLTKKDVLRNALTISGQHGHFGQHRLEASGWEEEQGMWPGRRSFVTCVAWAATGILSPTSSPCTPAQPFCRKGVNGWGVSLKDWLPVASEL